MVEISRLKQSGYGFGTEQKSVNSSFQPMLRKLASMAKHELQNTVLSFWRLGEIVAKARSDCGASVRLFSREVGVSHTHLGLALRFYQRYSDPKTIPKLEHLTINEVKQKIQTHEPKVELQTSLLTYGPRSKLLIECLHRFVRNGDAQNSMRTAWELAKGDQSTVSFLWNELQLMSDEETTDPLAIVAVDTLYHRVRDQEGRIASNSGIAVRCAMVAASILASSPKDRSSDDSFLYQRILEQSKSQISKAVQSANVLLSSKFEPVVAPSRELMHKGGKFGLEGDLSMALVGSRTNNRTRDYSKFRAEFEELVRSVSKLETRDATI